MLLTFRSTCRLDYGENTDAADESGKLNWRDARRFKRNATWSGLIPKIWAMFLKKFPKKTYYIQLFLFIYFYLLIYFLLFKMYFNKFYFNLFYFYIFQRCLKQILVFFFKKMEFKKKRKVNLFFNFFYKEYFLKKELKVFF